MGYASEAGTYWTHGWKGILPLPHGKKFPPPKNTTGYDGFWPSWPDLITWMEDYPDGNLGLRLPNSVIGIDVDHYQGKNGGDTLAHAENLWGTLPATMRSTSRIDGVSGIRLFQVPPGTQLETVLAFPEHGLGHVEVVQFFHRYVVAWPSLHEGTGRHYRWLDGDGHVTASLPRPGQLPHLPQPWITGLRRGNNTTVTTSVNTDAAVSALSTGAPSLLVSDELNRAFTDLNTDPASRHDVTLRHVLTLIRMSERGEPGVRDALAQLRAAFVSCVGADRGENEAAGEFDRMVEGQRGHNLIASTPTTELSLDQMVRQERERVSQQPESSTEPTPAVSTSQPDPTPTPAPTPDEELTDADRLLWAEEEGTEESARTSWGTVPLNSIIDGDLEPEEADLGRRSDGKALFYRGKINSLVGAPESGKSFLAFHAARQVIEAGGSVLIIDFEDSPKSVVMRLLNMGLSKPALRERLAYINPDSALSPEAASELFTAVDSARPELIVFDGVNAAMALLGLKMEDNNDANKLHQILLKPLAEFGAGVITVDHLPKSSMNRGPFAIGAQAKKAMIDGSMIQVTCVEQFGRGRLGELKLDVLKDKPGGVRAIAEKRGKDHSDYVGSVIIDSRDGNKINMSIIWKQKEGEGDGVHPEERKLAMKMMQISKMFEDHDPERKGLSQAKVISKVPGRESGIKAALDILVETHHVTTETGHRNAIIYRLDNPYQGIETERSPDPELDALIGSDESQDDD